MWKTLLSLLRSMFGAYEELEPYKESLPMNDPVKDTPDMMLEVSRFSSQKESTLGILYDVSVGRRFLCFTLEDEYRTKKVYGETRIPDGEYDLVLRTEGGFNKRYKQKFPNMHLGMLWVKDVPNFEYILIHIGNKDDDTAGCTLVGDTSTQNITEEGMVGSSTNAYKRIYPPIAKAIIDGKRVRIRYINYDTGG